MDINLGITDNGCAEYGFRWESEPVQTQAGPNGSDRKPVNRVAQIAVIENVEKFEAAFPGYILAMADGTSLRVSCQRIGRKFNGRDIAGNRRAVVEHLTGLRAKASRTVKRGLPDGTFYTGTDETEYRQAYAAALVDQGVDGDLAMGIARNVAW